MFNKVFQLIHPRQFSPVYKELEFDDRHIIVRPTYMSICHADQRYYQGKRAEAILRQKLPMALIHEAVGKVVYDPSETFAYGDHVVLIANTPRESDSVVAENYLQSSLFRGSGFDGFMQEYISMEADRVLALPDNINMATAAFTEMVSVSYHAIRRFATIAHERRDVIGIWGDGNLGYITALLLKHLEPHARLFVFGVSEAKLNDFAFTDETYMVASVPDGIKVDHAFECVGGPAASGAINQIIDHISPEGTVSLMGVSEDLVPMNTRMILERGLRLFGSSRSGRVDYEGVLELYNKAPDIMQRLDKLVGTEVLVHDIKDITTAFEIDIHKNTGKTVMQWNI